MSRPPHSASPLDPPFDPDDYGEDEDEEDDTGDDEEEDEDEDDDGGETWYVRAGRHACTEPDASA